MRAALTILAVVGLLVPAAQASYRNPTAGRELVVQLPGMHRAKVRRNVVYRQAGGVRLRLNVYRPRRARGALPAVLLGGPPGAGRTSGQKVGWAQLIAASGMAAVTFDIRSSGGLQTPEQPAGDVQAAIGYLRARAKGLGIDRTRLCTLGFSLGTGPWHLWATMREPAPFIRCNVSYYAPLDLGQGFPIDQADAEEFSASTYLRRFGPAIPPMLIVKAGRDATPGINESIDRFAAEAARVHADVRVLTHATAPHAFDVLARTARSKAVVRETLRFLKARLAKPLALRDSCVTSAERASAVRFFAADDTRLIGIGLGRGPRGVVLAHENRASLCNWLPYARQLAAAGYRVLAYDSRNSGSSGNSPLSSLDLDAVAAVEALRRNGAERVVLGGASIGATAALVGGASLADPPAGVFSLSGPFSSGPLHGGPAVGRLRCPLLLVAAEADAGFADDARNLYAASGSPDRTLAIVPGGAHGTQLLEDSNLRAAVTGFIARALGP